MATCHAAARCSRFSVRVPWATAPELLRDNNVQLRVAFDFDFGVATAVHVNSNFPPDLIAKVDLVIPFSIEFGLLAISALGDASCPLILRPILESNRSVERVR